MSMLPPDYEPENGIDRFLCGPRAHWPRKWRRVWLATLPVSWIVWPAVPVLLILVAYPTFKFCDWAKELWK